MAAAKSRSRKKGRGAGRSRCKSAGQQQLFRRGGKRRGAGRKSSKARPGRRHERRARFGARSPLHVVLRVDEAVGTLRRRAMYQAVRKATITAGQKQRIRIVHISLQRTHVHMIVEAADREALARGMQGFQVAAAKYVNRALGRERGSGPRRGCVFVERYYVEVITSPTQALRALHYALANWRHHGEDRGPEARAWPVDPFSSAAQFRGWVEIERGDVVCWPPVIGEPLVVSAPRTWLLAEGWKRVGTISAWTVPGPNARVTKAR